MVLLQYPILTRGVALEPPELRKRCGVWAPVEFSTPAARNQTAPKPSRSGRKDFYGCFPFRVDSFGVDADVYRCLSLVFLTSVFTTIVTFVPGGGNLFQMSLGKRELVKDFIVSERKDRAF